ncbi:M14 family zinc carboxypeptidase [Pontimicrobium aquaticum]|uniref:DUF2817 domain-containing protein n=1 Tax=Pontimicrobium aquaticum TaxID=2565367 RepID=A0A4U0EP91_9FLAO|nr:M14 family zinc carboxypeptidase [Pontimicrobium aquaticum]TJY33447.1 DUF2817 domain-containing protein [Pontimicrobium aquaticum]
MSKYSLLHSGYKQYKNASISHRYITNSQIEPLLKSLSKKCQVTSIGNSVNGLPIYGIQIGHGKKRVLMWSQMHGNESTTTKACFDMLNFLTENPHILEHCTLYIIPILNPDGAKAYTRVNANNVDLNRDAQNLTQPESLVLKSTFESFKPDFCFNLHGQRTIFSAGKKNKSAIISFLAPAQDEKCSITPNRRVAMELITSMNTMLQGFIPNCVGIYDDAFNINCVGDTFQSKNVPTILFEAGHYKNDYAREEVRQLIFMSLVTALDTIATNNSLGDNYESYFYIPQNQKLFYDIIIRNAKILNNNKLEILDVAVQYQEVLHNNKVNFIPKIKDFGDLSQFFGHKEVDAIQQHVVLGEANDLSLESAIDFIIINNELFSLKPINS